MSEKSWPDCPILIRTRGHRLTSLYLHTAMPIYTEKGWFKGQTMETAHWFWRGGLSTTGHPVGYLEDGRRASISRVVLEWWLDRPIQVGMAALHCKFANCVSPWHLEEGPSKLGQGKPREKSTLSPTMARQQRRDKQRFSEAIHQSGGRCDKATCVKCSIVVPKIQRTYHTESDEIDVPLVADDGDPAENMAWSLIAGEMELAGKSEREVERVMALASRMTAAEYRAGRRS